MMQQFFGTDFPERKVVVGEGSTLELGRHTLTFVTAPMVHWPEVIVTYDSTDKVLFSADGFGKFGALDVEEDWADEARRYYIASSASTAHRCRRSLKKPPRSTSPSFARCTAPVLNENLGYYLDKYNTWSSYAVEDEALSSPTPPSTAIRKKLWRSLPKS